MTRAQIAAALALALAAGAAGAEPVPFRLEKVIYVDSADKALNAPEGVACSDAGSVVVADTGNGRLVTYTYRDGVVGGGAALKVAQVAYPTRVQFDGKGNILVLDQKARKIFRLDPKGAVLGTLELKGAGAASSALPVAFKLDASDNVFVLDAVGGRVVVLDPAGKTLREIPLPKSKGGFTDVHVDAAGTVYALDGVEAQIWIADKVAMSFKTFTPGMKDKMNFPVYLTASKGKLFLVDQNGNGIVVLGSDGSYMGRQLAIGWGDGLVYYPAQLCLNAVGDGFLADRSNNRIQVFGVGR